jgi:PQQ-like domain/Dockerin type I domain
MLEENDMRINLVAAVTVSMALAAAASAADWSNSGGNAGRNGLTTETGPDAADVLWSGGPSSIIAWQPVIEDQRVFMVRQTGFPPEPASNESPVYALDLTTGAVLWFKHIPATPTDWTTWIAGVKDGKVFVARTGNGTTVNGKLLALDAATGGTLWTSVATINAGPYDGVVFADDGDPIIGDFNKVIRINAADGSTVWSSPRVCSVSSSCGGAIGSTGKGAAAIYLADAVPGGHAIKKFNLATGAFQYQSPVMLGFTLQNTPFVAPDGTIHLSRTQNNPITDFFYSFHDTGTSLMTNWSVPTGWSTTSEFAVGNDGTIYTWGIGNVIQRLDPDTGDVIDVSDPIQTDSNGPRMAVDALGRVYLSNGGFTQGRFYSFNADLSNRWSIAVPNINIGAPAIGSGGVLVVAGVGTNVVAYQTKQPCVADLDGSGVVNGLDLAMLLGAWGRCTGPTPPGCPTDLSGDGTVNGIDLAQLLAAWGPCRG